MLATLSQRRAIWTLQGPTEVLMRFDGATMGGALRRDGQSRRYDATVERRAISRSVRRDDMQNELSGTTVAWPRRGSEGRRPGDLVGLSGGQHTELMAIRVGHHYPADLALADVDASRSEGDETVDLSLLVTVGRWSEVEVQPVLPGLRHQWRTAPRDLRTAARRADRGLLVLVPDQRPSQRLAPEVPDPLRAIARQRPNESAVSKEVVARLDHAELVAFGVGEHHMTFLRALTDIDVRAPSPSDLATVCCWSSREVLVRSKCIWFWPDFCSWV